MTSDSDWSPAAASELGAWVTKYGWSDEGDTIFIRNQDESVKTKNIREKIDFETVRGSARNTQRGQ